MKAGSSRPPVLALALFALTFGAWAYALTVTRRDAPSPAPPRSSPGVEQPTVAPSVQPSVAPPEAVFVAPEVPEGQALVDVFLRVAPARGEETTERLERMQVRALNATGGSPASGLTRSQYVAEASEGRLRPLCAIPVVGLDRPGADERLRAEVAACQSQGAAGVFLSRSVGLGVRRPDRALLAVSDPLLDGLFDEAARRALPVVFEGPPPPAFFEPLEGNPERALLERHPELHHHGSMPDEALEWPTWGALFAQLRERLDRHEGPSLVLASAGTPRASLEALLASPGVRVGVDPRDPEQLALFAAHPRRVLVASGARVTTESVRDRHEQTWQSLDALFEIYDQIRRALASLPEPPFADAAEGAEILFRAR